MITINHLSKTFTNPDGTKLQVLKDINCEISKGEVISIIGPSGTGKSTLLRAFNMLDAPTSGEIVIDGENILAKGYPLNKLRQKVGMDKAIRFAGMGRWLEIWDEDRFAATCAESETDIGALLEYVNDRYYSPQS